MRQRVGGRFSLIIMLLSCLWLSFACSKASHVPDNAIVVRDQLGRTVALPQAAKRIVSLSPAATESLFHIGCGDRIVLRDNWSDYPIQSKEIASIDGFSPSAELILAARPDLVVAHFPTAALQAALNSAGVPWIALAPATLADVSASLATLGLLCGHAEDGRRAAATFAARQAAIESALQGATKPRVFYEMDGGDGSRPFTVGRGSFGHQLVEHGGGINVFGQRSEPWLQVGLEAIRAADPQLWLLADADSADRPQSPATVAARPGFGAIAAVRDGKFASLPADLAARPGPRLILGLAAAAKAIHPDRAAAIDAAPQAATAAQPLDVAPAAARGSQ